MGWPRFLARPVCDYCDQEVGPLGISLAPHYLWFEYRGMKAPVEDLCGKCRDRAESLLRPEWDKGNTKGPFTIELVPRQPARLQETP